MAPAGATGSTDTIVQLFRVSVSDVIGEWEKCELENAASNPRKSSDSQCERRLKELGIELTAPPEPFGPYTEAMWTGNLLF
jgi:hypothetical protein